MRTTLVKNSLEFDVLAGIRIFRTIHFIKSKLPSLLAYVLLIRDTRLKKMENKKEQKLATSIVIKAGVG
jgi:hypothetical protein